MVARVSVTTTVEDDGSVRLQESEIQAAGIHAGDRVRIEIVKEEQSTSPEQTSPTSVTSPPKVMSANELAALPFAEWLERFRADFPLPENIEVEELRRQAEDAVADEWWARFNRYE